MADGGLGALGADDDGWLGALHANGGPGALCTDACGCPGALVYLNLRTNLWSHISQDPDELMVALSGWLRFICLYKLPYHIKRTQ